MRLRNRILLLPLVTAVAFAVSLYVVAQASQENGRLIDRIQQESVPALTLSHQLQTVAIDLQRTLGEAAASRDGDQLSRTAELRDRFLELLAAGTTAPGLSANTLDQLRREFTSYYQSALVITDRLMVEGASEELLPELDRSAEAYARIIGRLKATVLQQQGEMELAFDAVKEKQPAGHGQGVGDDPRRARRARRALPSSGALGDPAAGASGRSGRPVGAG